MTRIPDHERDIVIGSRTSELAQRQARLVGDMLRRAWVDVRVRFATFETSGDLDRITPLSETGEKGVFTRDLQNALRAGEIDAAVHSLKDLPVVTDDEFVIAAIPDRADARDVLVTRDGLTLDRLPAGSIVGTSSLRRAAYVLHERPDLIVRPIRGNVETRIKKVIESEFDATILAAAGLLRLERLSTAYTILPIETALPAPGQGALAVECLRDNVRAVEVVRKIDITAYRSEVTAEREFLRRLGGGCSTPIGAYAHYERTRHAGDRIVLRASVWGAHGTRVISVSEAGDDPLLVARRAADSALSAGAVSIIRESRPLHARRVAVTRPLEQSQEIASLLSTRGATVVTTPLITIVPAADDKIARVVGRLSTYQWLVYTSANAVRISCDSILAAVRRLGSSSPCIAAVGPRTAEALRACGVEPALVPGDYTADALTRALGDKPEERVLVVRGAAAGDGVERRVTAAGKHADSIVVYTTERADVTREQRADLTENVDVVLLASGSAADAYAEVLAAENVRLGHDGLAGTVVACIGPSTAESARKLELPVRIVASDHTARGLVDAVETYFRESAAREERSS